MRFEVIELVSILSLIVFSVLLEVNVRFFINKFIVKLILVRYVVLYMCY